MRISDWSSDVCSSDLPSASASLRHGPRPYGREAASTGTADGFRNDRRARRRSRPAREDPTPHLPFRGPAPAALLPPFADATPPPASRPRPGRICVSQPLFKNLLACHPHTSAQVPPPYIFLLP